MTEGPPDQRREFEDDPVMRLLREYRADVEIDPAAKERAREALERRIQEDQANGQSEEMPDTPAAE